MHIAVLFSHLTHMEGVVIKEILRGKANKSIAGDLILSQRTIEAHRASVFQKMRVRNAIELTQLLLCHQRLKRQGRQVGPVWFSNSVTESISGCLLR